MTINSRFNILASMGSDLFAKLAKLGVVPREQVKNNLKEATALVRHGLLKKVYRKKRVFYELTEDSLPLLNHFRLKLLAEAKLRLGLYPRRKNFYQALLEDVRFLDTSKKEAEDFLFLGDWRLNMPPVVSQLKLSQLRLYQEEGLA